MNELIINNMEIRVDEFGRYCLTDLWKAGGAVVKDKPSQFTKQDSCKKIVDYLNERNRSFKSIETTRGKYTGGTWATKHIVYAYAMWISPEFQVRVIETFDAAATGQGDKAVAIAKDDSELKNLIDERDKLIISAESQSDRDEIERLTSIISMKTSNAGSALSAIRGKGKKFAERELNRINNKIQLDMFNGGIHE